VAEDLSSEGLEQLKLKNKPVLCQLGSGPLDTQEVVMSEAKLDILIHELQQAQASLQDVV
jgi:hypothetical protein